MTAILSGFLRRILPALPLILCAGGASARDQTYVNARFGTTCTFPDEVFSEPQPEPENGDGQQWLSPDGASLTCSGIYNVDDETPRDYLKSEQADLGANTTITYSNIGKTWLVVSGIKDSDIFYERHLFGRDGVIRSVWISYPSSLKAKFDPLVGKMADSLRGP